MPQEEFYAGLPFSQRIAKFIDHHSDPATRHISRYEAGMLDQIRSLIDQTLDVAVQEARRSIEAEYRRLSQTYETVVYGPGKGVSVQTFPIWHLSDPVDRILSTGLAALAEDPTPRQIEDAVTSVVLGAESFEMFDPPSDDGELSTDVSAGRFVDAEAYALVNRVLYLPVVPVENSFPNIGPILEHLAAARGRNAPVVMFGGVLWGTGSVSAAFLAGGSVIALRLLGQVAEGMGSNAHALGERLTRSWPDDDIDDDIDDESGDIQSAGPA